MAVTKSVIERYIELGFCIHPCCPVDHKCQSPGKIPFDAYHGCHMSGWQNHEQFPLDWWEEQIDYEPEVNIGFLTGSPSDLLCLDIDDNEGMALLGQLDIPWRDTWQYRTGRGLRVLYRHQGSGPTGIITRGSASIEVLGDGRQSVLPPSQHPNGSEYRWCVGNTPRDCGCSGRTDWLEHLGGASGSGGVDGLNSEDIDWMSVLSSPPREGDRNRFLTSVAGRLLSPGGLCCAEAEFFLKLYNRHQIPEPLPEGEVRSIVESVGRSEQRTRESGIREIKRIMIDHDVSFEDAKLMWQNEG